MRHKFRHLFSILLAVAILLPTAAIGLSAAEETEDNNTLAKADEINIGETVTGSFNQNEDKDIFLISLITPGEISINVSANAYSCRFYLYNEAGENLLSHQNYSDKGSGMASESYIFDLLPGNYYISLTGYCPQDYSGDYSVTTKFVEAKVTENENNDDIRSAQPVNLNETMYGFMPYTPSPDNYVFTVPTSGKYYIHFTAYFSSIGLKLLDENGNKIKSMDHNKSILSDSYEVVKTYEFDLEAGTYYLSATRSKVADYSGVYFGEYNFKIYPESKPEDTPTPPPSDEVDSSEIFNDVPRNAWYKIYIDFSITINIFTGTSATTFSPDMSMNRAMLVTVLWRLEGSPTVNCKLPFSDVNSSTWYTDAVKWAYSYGIVKGTSNTTFSPNMNITREQIATILYRYASETKSLNLGERHNLYSFSDGYKTNDFAWDALSWATAVEIINGANYGNGIVLDPQGVATRAQVAKILTVFYNNYMI